MATWYVDPGATGAGNGTSWTDAYTALQTAVAAKAASLSAPCIFKCRSSNGAADTTAVSVTGYTTSATNYIEISVDQEYRHDGKYNNQKYRLEVSNAGVLTISEDFVRVDGLQLIKTGSSGSNQCPLTIGSMAASNDIRISNCILKQDGVNTWTNPGVYISDADTNLEMWNCLVYGISNYNSSASGAVYVYTLTASTISFFDCVFVGNRYGLRLNNNVTVVAKNCYFYGTTAAVSYGTSAALTSTSCAASDASLAGTDDHDNVALNTSTFVNVTAGSEDFHLAGTGSPLYGHGADNTGDAAPLNFTTDIDGHTITGRFDIGADFYYIPVTNQFARPSSDVEDGGWTNESGNNTNLFESINEEVASDVDFIVSAGGAPADSCTVGLSAIQAPQAGTVTLRVRAAWL